MQLKKCLLTILIVSLHSSAQNLPTGPIRTRRIVQQAGSDFGTNNSSGVVYVVSSYDWTQRPSADISTPGEKTVTLAPCPPGIDTSANANAPYGVYISGTGIPEAVAVTKGSCTSGAATGTITFITAYAHAVGYAIGSANGGNQEARGLHSRFGMRRDCWYPHEYSILAPDIVRRESVTWRP